MHRRQPLRQHHRPLLVALAVVVAVQLLGGFAALRAAPTQTLGFASDEVRAELALLPEPPEVPAPPADDDAWLAAVAAVNDAEWLAAIDAIPERERVPADQVDSAALFAEEFPEHAAARQREGQPDTFHWAVVVGVNAYRGVGNTFGSVPDAEILRDELFARGWREDHVLVLTDQMATGDRIIRALEWLSRKTDDRSTVVFSKSGHIRHRGGVSALWPHDSRYIWADELGRLLAPIEADKMWLSFQGCHAAGLSAPGVEGDNRVVTYSSHTHEKSFEDPETGQSLQGFYMFTEGIRDGWGDRAGDGDVNGQVSVQEAHAWGAPRAAIRSAERQNPVMVDGLGRPFHLEIDER